MKKNKIGLILITVLLVACVALIATACNHDKGNKPKTYTLTFVAEGETIPSIVSASGKDITPPTAPEKENMNFVGWFLNNEGEAVELPTIMPAENRTYYARYEAIDDGGDEEIKIPGEYMLKLDEIDSDNHLYIDLDGSTVYLEYNGTVIKSELSIDGNYVEFTLNKKDYCAVLNGANASYGVYEYGFSKDSYTLYLPMDNSFNRERTLVFGEGNTFTIVGDYYGNVWASGTYSVINPSTQEYSLTVLEDNSYGKFGSCQVKLTKRVRQSSETGAKPLVYNAFNIFDEEIYGNFTSPDGEKLSLDGYGYAIYTDANGNTSNGYCEETDIAGFADTFFTVIDAATGKSSIYIVYQTTFMTVGNEVGIYRLYD
ncbi:MAG: InlB B-repeat-containing protein, partial [Clostridia bacterium]|nr:InlB B-repeat-containing protein [Clostridia bacterium]